MRVQVVEGITGYFNHRRRREGDVFVIPDQPRRKLAKSEIEGVHGQAFKAAMSPILDGEGKPTGEYDIPRLYSARWMRVVPSETPTRTTGATAALKQKHDEILSERVASRSGEIGDGGVEIDPNTSKPAGSNVADQGQQAQQKGPQDQDVI